MRINDGCHVPRRGYFHLSSTSTKMETGKSLSRRPAREYGKYTFNAHTTKGAGSPESIFYGPQNLLSTDVRRVNSGKHRTRFTTAATGPVEDLRRREKQKKETRRRRRSPSENKYFTRDITHHRSPSWLALYLSRIQQRYEATKHYEVLQ